MSICCKQPDKCCCEKGSIGEQGEKGPTGDPGLRGPSNENFVFGLTSTDGLDDDAVYWLVPGGQISRKATFDSSNVRVPSSMAVAYSHADISACAIHINRVPPAAAPVNFRFKIYAFCAVDRDGMPQNSTDADVNAEGVLDHYCQCQSLPVLATGCGTQRNEALAVSVTVSPRFANAISISLTLYSQSPLNVP